MSAFTSFLSLSLFTTTIDVFIGSSGTLHLSQEFEGSITYTTGLSFVFPLTALGILKPEKGHLEVQIERGEGREGK